MIAAGSTCAKCGAALDLGGWGRCSRCLAVELLRIQSMAPVREGEPLSSIGDYELIEEIARGGMA